MLDYNEVTPGAYVVLDGEPYECIASAIAKKSRQKASNQTKLKHLVTGRVIERAFHQSDNLEEADISKKTVVFIYATKGEVWFHEEDDKSARFSLPESMIGNRLNYLVAGAAIDALVFNDEVVDIRLPVKVDLKVTEAAPAVRGNTAQNATKQVTVETGMTVTVPMFIEEGDVLRINTETNTYVERAKQ